MGKVLPQKARVKEKADTTAPPQPCIYSKDELLQTGMCLTWRKGGREEEEEEKEKGNEEGKGKREERLELTVLIERYHCEQFFFFYAFFFFAFPKILTTHM